MKYIIGSGWWCGADTSDGKRVLYGDEKIRGVEFNKIWYDLLTKYTKPEKIIIVDSNSPVKPSTDYGDEVEFISLPINAGHAVKHTGKYCGWTRSVLLGLQYAILSDADYFVYVEQDTLLSKEGIIEHCIKNMNSDYLFGSGEGTSHSLQQSFFIISRRGMEKFMCRLQSINFTDNQISPESKFAIASSSFWSLFPNFLWAIKAGITSRVLHMHKGFQYVPFGYGRTRPINFLDEFFYFQHGTTDELKSFMEKIKAER